MHLLTAPDLKGFGGLPVAPRLSEAECVALFQMLAGRTPFAPSRDASPETCYKRIKEGAYTWPVQLPICTEVVDLVCPVVPYTLSSLSPSVTPSLSLPQDSNDATESMYYFIHSWWEDK